MRRLDDNPEVCRGFASEVLAQEGVVAVEEFQLLPAAQPWLLPTFFLRSFVGAVQGMHDPPAVVPVGFGGGEKGLGRIGIDLHGL